MAMPALGLDRASAVPLHRQLYEALRQAILEGRLRPGARLPSTRTLAVELGSPQYRARRRRAVDRRGISRGARGRGHDGPGRAARGPAPRPPRGRPFGAGRRDRAAAVQAGRAADPRPVRARLGAVARPFRPGAPAYDDSVIKRWGSSPRGTGSREPPSARLRRSPGLHAAARGDRHLPARARAVRCEAEQVMVVSRSQHGLDSPAPAPRPRRSRVGRGSRLSRRAGRADGGRARPVPVPVDGDGLDVARGHRAAPDARSPTSRPPTSTRSASP